MGLFIKFTALNICLLVSLLAMPARAANTLLSSQAMTPSGEDLRLEIQFEQPMNYISHFPENKGSQLDINLRPILTGQSGTIMATITDSLSVEKFTGSPVQDIQYEQDERGNGILTIHFTREVEYKVQSSRDNRSIIVTLLHAAVGVKKQQDNELPVVNVDSGLPIYVINLETDSQPIDPDKQPILKNFRGKYDIYAIDIQQDRKTLYQLRLGYFHSLKLAKANLERLLPFYPQAWVDRVRGDRRLIAENWFLKQSVAELEKPTTTDITTVPMTKGLATAPAAPAVPAKQPSVNATTVETPVATNDKLSKLMDRAKQAMISKDYRTAISYFTHILQNPDTEYHKEAQELLGLAWERSGLPAQARAEYEKYLKLYPSGPDSDRVKQRLVGLLTARSKPVAKLKEAPRPAVQRGPTPSWNFFGSFSQFYRNQQFETDVTKAVTTDNSLNSDLVVSGRRRGTTWDQRLDFAGTHRYDFLNKTKASDGTIYSLFYELADKNDDLSMRIGRQTHNSDGVLGRFDGFIVNKRIGHNKKFSLLAGYPVEISIKDSVNTNRRFYAASLKFESVIKNLDTKFYYINQTNYGLTDRVAVGNQTQYVDNFKTMFFIADYDIHYKELNQATFIGNWRFKNNSNVNITADYRKSPLLTTNNALIGQMSATTLEQLRNFFTLPEVEQLAQDRTGTLRSFTVSASKQLNPRYQLNGDATVSNLDGTPASGGVAATPSTGNLYYYNMNLVATNFLSSNDVTIMGLRYNTDVSSHATSGNFSTRFNINKNWRLNPRMTVELRNNNDGSKRTTYRPRIVIQDRAARTWRFEMEFGYEYAKTKSPTLTTTDKNYYGYLGYTHDF